MKQSMSSCRVRSQPFSLPLSPFAEIDLFHPHSQEASVFLKKRAQIEEEYARAMVKLSKSSIESYHLSDGKPGCVLSLLLLPLSYLADALPLTQFLLLLLGFPPPHPRTPR